MIIQSGRWVSLGTWDEGRETKDEGGRKKERKREAAREKEGGCLSEEK
jgi:hypothetical protein